MHCYIFSVFCYFRSKVTATAPTNLVQNSLPPQASNTQPLSSAQVTLSTPVRGAGQEAGLYISYEKVHGKWHVQVLKKSLSQPAD
jgi:hypothetical protein